MDSLKTMQERALDTTKPGTVNPVEMLRLEALTSFEKYTKLMFKAQYKRSSWPSIIKRYLKLCKMLWMAKLPD